MKSILDPQFQYIPAVATDIKATFERIRKEQQAEYIDTNPRKDYCVSKSDHRLEAAQERSKA